MAYTFEDQYRDRYGGTMPTQPGGGPDASVQKYYDLINGIKSGSIPMTFGGVPMSPGGMGGGAGGAGGSLFPSLMSGGAPTNTAPGSGFAGFSLGDVTNPTRQPGATLGIAGSLPVSSGGNDTDTGGGGPLWSGPYRPSAEESARWREQFPQIGGPGSALTGGPATGGTTGGTTSGNYADFDFSKWRDPGYDFRLGEGQKLLEGSAAARGGLLSGPTLKALTNYGQGAASQEFANAYGRFTGDRAFNYLADVGDRDFAYRASTGDRDFAYNAARDDRNFNTDIDRYLATLGYGATGGTVGSNNAISTLQTALEQARGNVGAAGTMGGSNAVTNALSQALAQMMQNRYMTPFQP